MFKCCIYNNISKKTEIKAKADNTPIVSPELTAISTKVDDEISTKEDDKALIKADKLNGTLQQSEDTFSVSLSFTPICNNSIKNSCEIAQNENTNIKGRSSFISIKKKLAIQFSKKIIAILMLLLKKWKMSILTYLAPSKQIFMMHRNI